MLPLAYCSHSDLTAHGVPRGATPNSGRVLASAVDNVCTLDGHDFATGDAIMFRPAGAGEMPAGLTEGTTYYAQREDDYTFRVRATAGGAALTFTDADDPLMVYAPVDKDAWIEWADRLIDDMCPAQKTPFDDATLYPDGVPSIVRMTSAELAACKGLAMTGSSPRSLAEVVDAAAKRLERWYKGQPVRNTPAESHAQVATGSTAAYCDRRGWGRYGGI